MPDDIEPSRRSNRASIAYTAIALVFFFGVGLGGGAAYKVYFGDDSGPQIATRVSSPPAVPGPPAGAPQNFPPQTIAGAEPSDIAKAGAELARIEPSAPPALAPPPAPLVPKQPGLPPPTIVQAAPTPPAAEPAPAPPDLMTAVPYADATPAPPQQDAPPEISAAAPTPVAAIPPKKPEKPAMVAKAQRLAPTAPSNGAGPYRVQFGAFANEDNARRVQWAIEATGLKIEVSQGPGPSGHPLYFVRSPSYPDHAAAVSAAQTVQHRINGFVNAIPIEYAILGDHSAAQQQAER